VPSGEYFTRVLNQLLIPILGILGVKDIPLFLSSERIFLCGCTRDPFLEESNSDYMKNCKEIT